MGYLPGWRVAGQPVCLSAEEPPGPDELIEMGYGFPHGKPALVGRKVPPGEPAGHIDGEPSVRKVPDQVGMIRESYRFSTRTKVWHFSSPRRTRRVPFTRDSISFSPAMIFTGAMNLTRSTIQSVNILE